MSARTRRGRTLPLEPVPTVEETKTFTSKVKFEVYGEEMIEKEVKQSGNSGRVYLPPEWIGKHVKIIRID
jgi:putative transposon-encoded protein